MSARMCCKHFLGTYHKGCLKGFRKCARSVVTDLVLFQIKCGDRPVRLVMLPLTTLRPFFSTTARGRLDRTMSCYNASSEAGFASNPILRFCCHAHAILCHPTNAPSILKWTGMPRRQIVRHLVLQHGLKFSRASYQKKKNLQSWRRMTRPLSQKVPRDPTLYDVLWHHVSNFQHFLHVFAPTSCPTHVRKIGCKMG